LYSNYSEAQGSKIPGGWKDPDDTYKTGPLKGQPKPSYGGYDLSVPGVALPYAGIVGAEGKQQGGIVLVNMPGRGPKVMARVVDRGPNQINPRSKDKGIDINAPLAEKLDLVQTSKQAKETGRPVFPDGVVQYEVIRTEDMLRARRELDVQRRRLSGATVPFTRHSKLDVEVNVHGPRGVNVDTSVSGDFKDQDTRVNRDFEGGGGSFGGGGASGQMPLL
jgi:hypothetical protein